MHQKLSKSLDDYFANRKPAISLPVLSPPLHHPRQQVEMRVPKTFKLTPKTVELVDRITGIMKLRNKKTKEYMIIEEALQLYISQNNIPLDDFLL
jgi:hypothetical protein